MPELVEVEAARHLCEKVLGKKVSRAWIKPDENKVITFPCTELASDITGLQVKKSGLRDLITTMTSAKMSLVTVSDRAARVVAINVLMPRHLAWGAFTPPAMLCPARYRCLSLSSWRTLSMSTSALIDARRRCSGKGTKADGRRRPMRRNDTQCRNS